MCPRPPRPILALSLLCALLVGCGAPAAPAAAPQMVASTSTAAPEPTATPPIEQATTTPVPATSTPAAVSLAGSLFVQADDTVYALRGDGQSADIRAEQLASQVTTAALAPDGQLLLYATDGETLLHDLRTGQAQTVLQQPARCLSWAPDSTRFSYTLLASPSASDGSAEARPGLYVADLSGASRLLVEPPSGTYQSQENSSLQVERYGRIACADWLSPDQLLLRRFAGPMPETITQGDERELAPNTTTLVTLAEEPGLLDTAEPWTLQDRCASEPLALLLQAGPDNAPTDPANALYLVEAGAARTFEELGAQRLELERTSYRFTPDCNLYSLNSNASDTELSLALRDRVTGEETSVVIPLDPVLALGINRSQLPQALWLGEGEASTLALVHGADYSFAPAISLIDLNGSSAPLSLPIPPAGRVRLLGYAPS